MFNLTLLAILVGNFVFLDAHERITSFMSNIKIHTDTTLEVQESIEVISEHKQIVHGLVREFPTKYQDRNGIYYVVDFDIKSITHNGHAVPYKIESIVNGKKIYIGDKDVIVSKGKHQYVITYSTNRQLGFFNDHDELYWNVTGNGWRLPIEKVEACVRLPEGISYKQIDTQAYTGYQNEQGENYECFVVDNFICFVTKHQLKEYEGITIVTAIPKGFIVEPSNYQKIYWFFRDNILILLLLIGLLLLAAVIAFGVMTARRINKPGLVIPLFYPPKGMMPCEVGYMEKMAFDNGLLSADIVHLAVSNYITITYKKNILYGGTYTLTIKDSMIKIKNDPNIEEYEKNLLAALFGTQESVTLSKENSKKIQAALQVCKKRTEKYCGSFFTTLTNFLYGSGFLIFLLTFCVFFWIYNLDMIIESCPYSIGMSMLIPFIFTALLKNIFLVYTPAGRKKQDAIDGFKLYLSMAEVEKMHFVGTPPTKTPELYEKYLPYAIALGIEKKWTEQFSSVFKQFEIKHGHAYHPSWYYGRPFRVNNIRSNFTNACTSAIASSSMRPGSSSGSGGRGRSGGGGGGGGGGGW